MQILGSSFGSNLGPKTGPGFSDPIVIFLRLAKGVPKMGPFLGPDFGTNFGTIFAFFNEACQKMRRFWGDSLPGGNLVFFFAAAGLAVASSPPCIGIEGLEIGFQRLL
jgi:hypothetical protein